jgi:acyl-homoserine lactone acylase PvdQ
LATTLEARGTVEILRDRAGVPHQYAATTADLYFGLGFAMAQDRLWQMDRLRQLFPERLLPLLASQTGAAARRIEHGDQDGWFHTDLQDEIVAAARCAVELVHEHFGADQSAWRWGDVHRAHWRHPLSAPARTWMAIGPLPVDEDWLAGRYHTVHLRRADVERDLENTTTLEAIA